ncbi:MAG: hypothetical protein IPN90_10100 [Elusimicrobia bacterium]|nr:hypothetical protein [Elusimicrobiota bacterium]
MKKNSDKNNAGVFLGFVVGYKCVRVAVFFVACAIALILNPALLRAEGDSLALDPYGISTGPTPWNMGFALSFPKGTGETESVVKDGFGLDFYAGYQKPSSVLGFRFDVMYASFNLTDAVTTRLENASEGNLAVFGGGPSLVVCPPLGKYLRPSVYVGPGLYYEHASATWDDSCDPLFGCGAGGTEYNTSNMSTTRLGWQGGVGLDLLFDGGLGAISFNVQYVTINNTNADVQFIPINIGYKVFF